MEILLFFLSMDFIVTLLHGNMTRLKKHPVPAKKKPKIFHDDKSTRRLQLRICNTYDSLNGRISSCSLCKMFIKSCDDPRTIGGAFVDICDKYTYFFPGFCQYVL